MTAVRRAAWLTGDLLLLVADGAAGTDDGSTATAALEACAFERGPATIYAVSAPGRTLTGPTLTFRAGTGAVALPAADVLEAGTDLTTLLREELAIWPAEARAETLSFLASLPLALGGSPALTASLRHAREALRERCPVSVSDDRSGRAIGVTAVCALDRTGFYIDGWVRDAAAPLMRLTALSPEGERVELAERAARYRLDPASDDRSGFVCFLETRAPSVGSGWVVEMEDATGDGVEAAEIPWIDAPAPARDAILAAVGHDAEDRDALLESHVEPALTRLQAALRDRLGIAALDVHGEAAEPAVAIVVVLDGPLELLERQVALLADDASLSDCELIYVIDRPQDGEHARRLAAQLHELYGIPLRLVVPTERAGPALARGLGASVATAARLLFLDADVVPAVAGWLPAMARFQDATPAAGPVAPKLVREDHSIAHAGFEFERDHDGGWTRVSRFEGLHETLPAAGVIRPVAAVGASCMLVDTELYRALDGFPWRYTDGGYDACDLCLRAERDSWYLPHVTLFELGIPGTPVGERVLSDRYDSWLLGRLRGEAIAAGQE